VIANLPEMHIDEKLIETITIMKTLAKRIIKIISQCGIIGDYLDKVCTYYHKCHENLDYNAESNGEEWIIDRLSSSQMLGICFDVGANKGEWSEAVLQKSSDSIIHCFEAVPATHAKLIENLSLHKKIFLNNIGLSDVTGEKTINYCATQDGLSSLYQIVLPDGTTPVSVQLVRSQDYCQNANVDRIDFLKIDTEGAEYSILRGFGEMLQPEKIRVIQFEYGYMNASIGILLKDFYELLESRGYIVGKLFPDYVRFRNYSVFDEDFIGPNYIATCKSYSKYLSKNNLL
jgi:FkbM family methyltransferase